MHRFMAFTFLLPRNDDADQFEIFSSAFYVGFTWLIDQFMRSLIFKVENFHENSIFNETLCLRKTNLKFEIFRYS